MIPPRSSVKARAFSTVPVRKSAGQRARRTHTVQVQAIFGRKAPASQSSNAGGAELISSTAKRFKNPSQAGNEAIAEALSQLGRTNVNIKSGAFYGNWDILYASGRSGLTALEGNISTFRVSRDGSYENECTTKIVGLFTGYNKEGGELKITGGNKYELIQNYQEFKTGPGGVLLEEVEQATVRAFEALYLDDDVLVTRLASTRFADPETGRMTTVKPEDDYYLVWQKEGARIGSSQPPVVDETVDEADDEVLPAKPAGGLFGSFGTAVIGRGRDAGLATIAERDSGEDAAQDRRQAQADERARKAAEREEKKRAQQEARAQKIAEQQARKQADAENRAAKQRAARAARSGPSDSDTTVVSKGGFGLGGLFGGGAKASEDGTAVVGGGSQRRGGTQRGGGGGGSQAIDRRAQAEERKRQQAEARAQKQAEAEERKRQQEAERQAKMKEQQEAKERQQREQQEAAAMRERIQAVVNEMQNDVKESSGNVKDITGLLRTAERESRDAEKMAASARQVLDRAQTEFDSAESELDVANDGFNQIAQLLRDKQRELNDAEKTVSNLERDLLKF